MPQKPFYYTSEAGRINARRHFLSRRWGALPVPRVVDLSTVWSSLIGKQVGDSDEAQNRIEINKRLDNLIARKLEAGGVNCRKESAERIVDLPLDGGMPIVVREIGDKQIARRQIFYSHQATIGREVKKRLDLLFQQLPPHQKKHVRMGVLSAGWVPLSQLAETISDLRKLVRTVSKIMTKYEVELIFSNVEAPMLRHTNGDVLLNLHSHTLAIYHRYLGNSIEDMNSEIVEASARILKKRYWHDSGRVRNLEELVKYSSKGDPAPDDNEEDAGRQNATKIGVEELTVAETVDLHNGWARRNRFTPHGRAKQLWQMLDRGILVNKEDELGFIQARAEKMKIASLGKGDDGNRQLALTPRFPREIAPEYAKNCNEPTNIVLGTTIRAVKRDGVRRLIGCLRVMNPHGDVHAVITHRKLFKLLELHKSILESILAREALAAREAGAISIQDTKSVNFRVGTAAVPESGAVIPPQKLSLVA